MKRRNRSLLTEGGIVITLWAANDLLLDLGSGYLVFSVSCVYYTAILKHSKKKGQGAN